MKNIFLVINREKVYAYIVSILTIVTLFFVSKILDSKITHVEETSTNIEINEITNNLVGDNNI